MKTFIAITAIAGLALAAVGTSNLKRSEAGIRYHHNPFALHESAYGKLLAELSQDTVDQVWHIGIEQVNPASHRHSGDHDNHKGHDHGPGEECETCKKAGQANDLLDSVATTTTATPEPDHGDHHDHDHSGPTHDHSGHDHDHSEHAHDHSGHAHVDPGHGHSGHVHDEHCSHGHADHHYTGSLVDAIASAKGFLVDLKNARYERTNPNSISEAHKLQVAGEIEQMLMRSYQMDPTNYGVYNAYYLFLTIHELGATPAAIEQARKISHHTIARAQKEKVAPAPWLTADMALLNLFLLDQQDWNKKGIEPPIEKLREYRNFSAYCKQNFAVLKQRAIADGRWQTISQDKRDEMDEHQQFASKTFEQFDVMIARQSEKKSIIPALPNVLDLPVAASKSEDTDAATEK